jgi:hypothetical protein
MQLIRFIGGLVPYQRWLPDLDVTERPDLRGTAQGLWIEPGRLLELINGWVIADWALRVTYRVRPALAPRTGPGRPYTYSDTVVLLTVIVMRVWRKGYESFTGWLGRNPSLAHSLGYTTYDAEGHLETISAAQLSRRTRHLGFLPFVLFFVALVWQLIRLGAITGRDLIIDSSRLKAWYHADPDADWSYPTARSGYLFGYKIHTLVCRHFVLPVFFWVTPASANDGPWAIPLLVAAVILYGFQVWIVRADGAYFTWDILGFIHDILGASPMVDYNVRRRNRQLVTLRFIAEWEGLMGPRSDIERHFAWAKRYFGLKYFQVETWLNVMTYACCIYIAMLAVALVACRCQRPELAGSRTRVLAWA